MSELEASIRGLISDYLARAVDADDLNDRLPDGWDLDEADDAAASDLALSVLGYLAGYHAGDRSEDDLRRALAELTEQVTMIEYRAEVDLYAVLTSRAAATIPLAVAADSSPVEGFEQASSQHLRTEHRTTTALLDRPGRR